VQHQWSAHSDLTHWVGVFLVPTVPHQSFKA
jgi:hypothetical protein